MEAHITAVFLCVLHVLSIAMYARSAAAGLAVSDDAGISIWWKLSGAERAALEEKVRKQWRRKQKVKRRQVCAYLCRQYC